MARLKSFTQKIFHDGDMKAVICITYLHHAPVYLSEVIRLSSPTVYIVAALSAGKFLDYNYCQQKPDHTAC